MSQQAHWKASALAATFSSNAGFNGTAWGAAKPPARMVSSDISCGLGFGQSTMLGVSNSDVSSGGFGMFAPFSHCRSNSPQQGYEAASRRQKRKASSEDESMSSPSPTPEPAVRKIRTTAEARRYAHNSDRPVAASISSSSSGRRPGTLNGSTSSYSNRAQQVGSYLDGRKRTRVMDVAMPNEVSLDKLLEPLEEKSLRSLLDALILQNPNLASQVRELVPKPTVNSACSQLARLERRLQAAFPYNKAGPASDDYTYHRVRPALEELRDTIVMYLDHFTHYGLVSSRQGTASTNTSTSSTNNTHGDRRVEQPAANALSHPAEWFDLLTQATDVAMRMPRWDRPENNEIRRETLRQLADGWMRAIMATARWTEEGHIAGRDMLLEWAQQLEHFYSNCGEPALFQPAIQVFQRSFGQYYGRGTGRMPLESMA
ncbi:Tethering factor for nuclear proteasome sts1 [Coemansia spiralis]|uniref:Tethering factor for nuclear proteasome STS1 n=2 Tax=Coemansia TaxID=4863 RepID=A0A9W8KYJ8_9FUNG|nr:hypothetical protein BX070DRAFT_254160 [Coemansia spiralis]KAJ1993097.1 Tethering factor for nuclear proteasome sts1 [Coemansia umbellata]KAJ2623787.1 Tethering factor for nuclear proteasome sts1 [Coemansia sp. RSA 1358]KAJ2677736.1 Tethering factor for nuclear proteasome sts1 [Coemansia spiralis]